MQLVFLLAKNVACLPIGQEYSMSSCWPGVRLLFAVDQVCSFCLTVWRKACFLLCRRNAYLPVGQEFSLASCLTGGQLVLLGEVESLPSYIGQEISLCLPFSQDEICVSVGQQGSSSSCWPVWNLLFCWPGGKLVFLLARRATCIAIGQ
jgi:hypothetical protein